MSKNTAMLPQGIAMSVMLGVGLLTRAVAPFVCKSISVHFMIAASTLCLHIDIQSYEVTGRHTYFAMAILSGCALTLILSLLALYKRLVPIPKTNTVAISATGKLSFEVSEEV